MPRSLHPGSILPRGLVIDHVEAGVDLTITARPVAALARGPGCDQPSSRIHRRCMRPGLRRCDAVRLGRPHVRNGEFTIRTEKTEMIVIAPILPQLAASIAAAPTRELIFIATTRGRPFTKELFGT